MFHPATWLRKPRTRFIIFKNDVSPTNELFHSFPFPSTRVNSPTNRKERVERKKERKKHDSGENSSRDCAIPLPVHVYMRVCTILITTKGNAGLKQQRRGVGARCCTGLERVTRDASRGKGPRNMIHFLRIKFERYRAHVCACPRTHAHTHTLLPWTRYLMTHALIVKLLFRVD